MSADEFMVTSLLDRDEIIETFWFLKRMGHLSNNDYLVFFGFIETYMFCER